MTVDLTLQTKGSVIGKGIVMIILGIILGCFSFFGAAFVNVMLSILLIVLGIAMICGVSNLKKLSVLGVVFGILFVILGVICLINPELLGVAIPYIVTAAAFIWGIFSLVSGIAGKGENRAVFIFTGVLGIILGILLVCYLFKLTSVFGPVVGAMICEVGLVALGGLFLFIAGIMVLIEGICMKSNKGKPVEA